jgi:hypothetical protein
MRIPVTRSFRSLLWIKIATGIHSPYDWRFDPKKPDEITAEPYVIKISGCA